MIRTVVLTCVPLGIVIAGSSRVGSGGWVDQIIDTKKQAPNSTIFLEPLLIAKLFIPVPASAAARSVTTAAVSCPANTCRDGSLGLFDLWQMTVY